MLEIGGAFITTGDPTETDLKKAAARRGHPLLYLVEGRLGNQPISMKSVMITALDVGTAPGLTPESYLKSIGQRFKQTGVPMELSGMPEQIAIGGKVSGKGTSQFRRRPVASTSPSSSRRIRGIFCSLLWFARTFCVSAKLKNL